MINVESIIDLRIHCIDYETLQNKVIDLSADARSALICFANVHVLMEAYDSLEYRQIVNSADFVVPDGMPLVWLMRLNGQKNQSRIYGPTFMLHVLEAASRSNIPVGFYGGRPETLRVLTQKMQERFKGLQIAYSFSPSFTEDLMEQESAIEEIRKSNTRILFVGLGCPKQEIWMARQKGKINAVMLGVGAAFDFHAGLKPQAPTWMQRFGLEWLFRLLSEPRRLWKRYLYQNPRFIFLVFAELVSKMLKIQ